jgi:hypothetical protein
MAWNEEPAVITKVTRLRGMWHIETKGSGFAFDTKYTKGKGAPQVGDEIICHTVQGSTVRGVTLRGELLYYKTDEELEQDREKWKEEHQQKKLKEFNRNRLKLNKAYDALPPEFQRRISWFRAHNPDFRVEFEAYEMSCCTDAALIVETLGTAKQVEKFAKASHKKQHEMVPGLYDGHSGNSFGMAVSLARMYVANPLWVIAQHGALTPLVGCEEYGCAHPRPADVIASLPEEKGE